MPSKTFVMLYKKLPDHFKPRSYLEMILLKGIVYELQDGVACTLAELAGNILWFGPAPLRRVDKLW